MSRIKRRRSNLVINDETRLFIGSLESLCEKSYDYHSCIILDGVSLNKSEVEIEYIPSDRHYDKFDIYAQMPGFVQPGTSSLNTNFTLDNSVLGKYFNTNCSFDMQVHIGKCSTKPSEFALFDKAIIFKNVSINSYNIDSIMSGKKTDVAPITESVNFSFEKMFEVSKPTFVEQISDIVAAGPIIDSFVFCNDSRCNLCVGMTGKYYVQLVVCGDECNQLRVIYTLDNGKTWRTKPINICNSIECHHSQFVNTNIVSNTSSIYYLGLNQSAGKTIPQIIDNSMDVFAKSLMVGTDLINAFTKYNTTFFVGTNGRIFVSEYGIFKRLINTQLDITKDIFTIHSIDGENFIAGSENGRIYIGTVSNSIESLTIPNSGNVYAVAMISNCSFIASTGSTGAVLFTNGRISKVKGIRGTITKFAFFNEDIGYASSIVGNSVYFWQTVNGGKDWQQLDTVLSTNYVVTTIEICELNHNVISIAGRKMETAVSTEDATDPSILWDCQGQGFILFSV